MIVSDNGSNMVKAVKLLNDCHNEEKSAQEGADGNCYFSHLLHPSFLAQKKRFYRK